jgi:hypothetical protein
MLVNSFGNRLLGPLDWHRHKASTIQIPPLGLELVFTSSTFEMGSVILLLMQFWAIRLPTTAMKEAELEVSQRTWTFY